MTKAEAIPFLCLNFIKAELASSEDVHRSMRCPSCPRAVLGSLRDEAVLMLGRLSAWCLMQASFLCRTRAGLFLFTERFQVKFITPPGVTGVVQLCLESGCEVGLVSVESFTEFLMAMSDASCLCRSLYTSLVFLSPSLQVLLVLSRDQQASDNCCH